MLVHNGYKCQAGFIMGSNIYNVLCPGRFNFLWASVGSTVTYEGKLRKNAFMSNKFGKTIKSIDTDKLWPDAWKIQIQIKDLTPNNFNTYIEYFINGFSGETIEMLNNKDSNKNLNDMLESNTKLSGQIDDVKNMVKSWQDEALVNQKNSGFLTVKTTANTPKERTINEFNLLNKTFNTK